MQMSPLNLTTFSSTIEVASSLGGAFATGFAVVLILKLRSSSLFELRLFVNLLLEFDHL